MKVVNHRTLQKPFFRRVVSGSMHAAGMIGASAARHPLLIFGLGTLLGMYWYRNRQEKDVVSNEAQGSANADDV